MKSARLGAARVAERFLIGDPPSSAQCERLLEHFETEIGEQMRAAQRCGVMRLIRVSTLGASRCPPALSDRSKAAGESAVREVFRKGTIVRPSLTYSEDDHFFSRFAAMIRSSPVLPVIGGSATKSSQFSLMT